MCGGRGGRGEEERYQGGSGNHSSQIAPAAARHHETVQAQCGRGMCECVCVCVCVCACVCVCLSVCMCVCVCVRECMCA